MLCRAVSLAGASLVVCLFVSPLRADPVPWSYQWTPSPPGNPQTQSITLGDAQHGFNTYNVTLSVAPPGAPGSVVLGSITGVVQVTPAATPEPSALLLAGVGLTCAGVAGRWTRRPRS